MIITESVYELINELCTSLHSDLQKNQPHIRSTTKQLRACKNRTHEILLKKKSSALDPHELYLHQFELALQDESGERCVKMDECCRFVERDEYFKTEIGKSILTFLLKLRNSSESVTNRIQVSGHEKRHKNIC